MGRRAPTAFATAVALVGLFLLGCGEGDNTTTAHSSTSAQVGEQEGGGAQRGSGRPSAEAASEAALLPDPRPGSKAAAPGVPVIEGGDNSIQTYGREADAAARTRLTAIVQAYLDARAAGDWANACSYLTTKQRKMLKGLASASLHLENPSCAAAEAASIPTTARITLRAEAKIDVLSLRMGSRYAFLIYRRPDGKAYASALGREGAAWKVVSVAPTQVG